MWPGMASIADSSVVAAGPVESRKGTGPTSRRYSWRAMVKQTPQEEMREFLTGQSAVPVAVRRVFSSLPTGPNCKICAAPFAGPAGAVLRHVGFGRFAGNPTICNFCIKDLQRMGVQGAEISVSLLFADIRGLTGIGERLSPTAFRAYLDRFYRM